MLLDRPIPKALFYSHVRLEAKRNALDALSCFGTDRTSTQAAAQDPLRKEGLRHKLRHTNFPWRMVSDCLGDSPAFSVS
jgi:hypothetical protein